MNKVMDFSRRAVVIVPEAEIKNLKSSMRP